MTTSTCNNSDFTFRSKFKKLLNSENVQIIEEAFEKFCNMNPDKARDFLWRLTYNLETASSALKELNKNFEITLQEEVISFRNELRFQYEILHPNFLDIKIPDAKCQEAFVKMQKISDPIVASVVYEHINSISTDIENYSSLMDRTFYLLNSDNENYYFGGIRCLNFTIEEASFLKKYIRQIADLFKAFYEIEKSYFITSATSEVVNSADSPEEVYSEPKLKKAPVIVKEAKESEEPKKLKEEIIDTSNYKALTAEDILKNKEIFGYFAEDPNDLNRLLPIGNLGYNLNEVMGKKDKIANLLKIATALIN